MVGYVVPCMVLVIFILHVMKFPFSFVAPEKKWNASWFLKSRHECRGLLAKEASVGSAAFSDNLWPRAHLSHPLWVLECTGVNLLVLKGFSVAYLDFTGLYPDLKEVPSRWGEELSLERVWGLPSGRKEKSPYVVAVSESSLTTHFQKRPLVENMVIDSQRVSQRH